MIIKLLGDTVNVLVLCAALFYQTLGSQSWSAEGFCLSFKGTYYHTHLLCFYGDVLSGLCLWLICKDTRPELRVAKNSIPSVVGHGFAHLFLWYHGGTAGVFHVLGISVFFFFFLQVLSTGSIELKAAQSLVHGAILIYFVPLTMAFTYVNTVLFVNLTLTQLALGLEGHKDRFYLLFSIAEALVMAAAIAEPLLCDHWLIHWGGHVFFDYSIPIATIFYYSIGKFLRPR
jgi:hypothetical protein